MKKARKYPSARTLRLTQPMADSLAETASTARLSQSDFMRRLIQCAIRAATNFDWPSLDERGKDIR